MASSSDANMWTRVYPEEGTRTCPYCRKACWKTKRLERHVVESHGPTQRQWKCSECSRTFPTKQGVAIHFASAHAKTTETPNVVSGSTSEEGDEELETFPFSFCDKSLPSHQGLRNHERRWHQGEVSASLAQQAEPPIKKRVRWTEDEARLFKEAIVLWGSRSNKKIAEMVGTKSSAQVSSYKRRFLRKYPVWATFSDPPSVATTTATSMGTNSPLSGSSESSESPQASPAESQLPPQHQQESPENSTIPSQNLPEAPPVGQVSTPSPSLSVLLEREEPDEETNRLPPPGVSSRSRVLLEEADRAIKRLCGQPTGGEVEGPTRADSPIPQSMSEESHNTGEVPARPMEEVLQLLDILVSTPSPSQRELMGPAVDIHLRSPNPRLGDELDWETPLPLIPLQCTEDRPPVPGWQNGPLGWPYCPLSPAWEFNSHPGRSPGPRWPYSPLNSSEEDITIPSQQNSQPRDEFFSTFPPPTQPPISSRYGPDYALRDYLQWQKGGELSGKNWPYSPITPSSPGPGPTHGDNLRGSTEWMDSQKSGKGKSPVGRKGTNKGKGGRGVGGHLPREYQRGGRQWGCRDN